MNLTITNDSIDLPVGGEVILRHQTWQDYIQNYQAILGKERIDLEVDPSPDLAIEVDLTSSTQPEIYQTIGVPELWIYRVQALRIYLFDGQQYQASEASSIFPTIDMKQILPFYVERAWNAGASVALREFEQ